MARARVGTVLGTMEVKQIFLVMVVMVIVMIIVIVMVMVIFFILQMSLKHN